MAITYKIFPNERLIRVSATAIVRAKDMDDFVDALQADPALEPRLRILYDARYSEPDIPILRLAEVAGRLQRLMDRGVLRIAMVAESKTTLRMAKTFAVLARALPVIREIVVSHPDQLVVVVSHKATLRLVLSSILGFDARGYRDRLDQSPACLNVVDFKDPVRARLMLFNDTSHYADRPRVPNTNLSKWWDMAKS